VQKDEKVLKRKYEVKNLNTFWMGYLAIKDEQEVSKGFGHPQYLLNQYHFEFNGS
jgi:hypothetical protein